MGEPKRESIYWYLQWDQTNKYPAGFYLVSVPVRPFVVWKSWKHDHEYYHFVAKNLYPWHHGRAWNVLGKFKTNHESNCFWSSFVKSKESPVELHAKHKSNYFAYILVHRSNYLHIFYVFLADLHLRFGSPLIILQLGCYVPSCCIISNLRYIYSTTTLSLIFYFFIFFIFLPPLSLPYVCDPP